MDYIELLKDAIVTTISCFLGGWAAIKFQKNANADAEITKNVDNARIAQLALIRQYNFLLSVDNGLIKKFPINDFSALASAPPMITWVPKDAVNENAISFLFDENSQGLLADIKLAEDKYNNIASILDKRNALHLSLQVKYADGPTDKWVLNQQEFFNLKSLTEGLYSNTSEALIYYEELLEKVFRQLKQRFPNAKFHIFQKGA